MKLSNGRERNLWIVKNNTNITDKNVGNNLGTASPKVITNILVLFKHTRILTFTHLKNEILN